MLPSTGLRPCAVVEPVVAAPPTRTFSSAAFQAAMGGERRTANLNVRPLPARCQFSSPVQQAGIGHLRHGPGGSGRR